MGHPGEIPYSSYYRNMADSVLTNNRPCFLTVGVFPWPTTVSLQALDALTLPGSVTQLVVGDVRKDYISQLTQLRGSGSGTININHE